MQAYATSEPEIRVHVRDGFKELVRTVAELAGVHEEETWDFFAYGMLLNVVARSTSDWKRPASDLPPPARDPAGARWCSCWSRRCSRCRCSASSATTTTSTTRRPRRSRRATRSPTPTGAFAAPSVVALVRLGAPVETRAGARADRARGARRCGFRGVASVVALRARRRPPAGLPRRALDLPAGDVQARTRRARGPIIEQRLARRAVRDARRRRVRGARRSATRSRRTSRAPS